MSDYAVWIATVLMLVMIFIKVPIYASVLLSSISYFLISDTNIFFAAQRITSGIESVSLLACPFFIMAGVLFNYTGVTDRLVKFCSLVTGRMNGGLAQANILLSTIMGGMSGSSNADAAMEAKILVPAMEESGQSKAFATVITAFSSTITPLIPPGIAMILFGILLLYVFILGGEARFSVETGVTAMGNMVQNFIGLSTWTDAARTEAGFAQNWTIFYWAYWMVWCVAAPFFMGMISRGRTIKQVIMGSYVFGTASTLISFIVLGNFGLGMKVHGRFDAVAQYYANGEDLYQTIIDIIHQLPLAPIFLVVLALAMFAFYATSFDSITMVASNYSYKNMDNDEVASKKMKLFWAVLLIMLPIALIFSEGTMANLQTVSIIAAFPIGIVMILIVASFIKDAKEYSKELKAKNKETD